jgi:ABC-type enterochelin transport system substrate-binding protein
MQRKFFGVRFLEMARIITSARSSKTYDALKPQIASTIYIDSKIGENKFITI